MHPKAKKPALTGTNQPSISFLNGTWFGAAGLLLLTLLIYAPSYKAGFIWDDDVVAGNPVLKEGWSGLRDIWFSTRFGDFVPLTATTFWIEWQIHGAMKEIQHATNIVLHALNVVLLWRILILLRIPGAWIAAAVFAVHPVCVSSVTWLAERKNTLSMTFYFLSLLLYLRSENANAAKTTSHFRQASYWFSFVFFLLGLLSKSSIVVLPVVMLLCAWWRHGKIDRPSILRTLPFFLFAFAAGVGTLLAHFYYGPKLGVLPTGDNSLTRILTAGRAFWFYLSKDLFPVGLTLHYARWKIDPASPLAYLPGLAIVGMLALLWKFRQSWGKACLFGFGYFLVALGPAIGVVNMAFLMMGQVADHFQYLALPGTIALLVGGGLYIFQKTFPTAQQAIPVILFFALVAPLAALSWQHQRIMANPEALWRDNLKKNPTSWASNNNLGGIHFERGDLVEAERLYKEALKTRGNLSMVHVNVGRALFAQGKTEEAIPRYLEALRLDPGDFKAHNNLGVAMITLGRTNDAIASFKKAVEINPGDATFFANLAKLLVMSGRRPEAIELFQDRLKRAADPVAHKQVGQLLFEEGRLDEAKAHFLEALRLTPNYVEAHFGLAEILARQNKKAEAIGHWRHILKLQPDALPVLGNLAWALATDPNDQLRNGGEAVILAERASAIAGKKNPQYLDLLAAAYAEAGRFPEAERTAEEAMREAVAAGQQDSSANYRLRMSLYKKGVPFRNE